MRPGMKGRVLEHRADLRARLLELLVAQAAERRGAGGRAHEAQQRAQRRALAGAVGPEKARHAAGLDVEAQVVDGEDGAEALGEVAYLDGCHSPCMMAHSRARRAALQAARRCATLRCGRASGQLDSSRSSGVRKRGVTRTSPIQCLQARRLGGDARAGLGPDVLEQPHDDLAAGLALRPAADDPPVAPHRGADVAAAVEAARRGARRDTTRAPASPSGRDRAPAAAPPTAPAARRPARRPRRAARPVGAAGRARPRRCRPARARA